MIKKAQKTAYFRLLLLSFLLAACTQKTAHYSEHELQQQATIEKSIIKEKEIHFKVALKYNAQFPDKEIKQTKEGEILTIPPISNQIMKHQFPILKPELLDNAIEDSENQLEQLQQKIEIFSQENEDPSEFAIKQNRNLAAHVDVLEKYALPTEHSIYKVFARISFLNMQALIFSSRLKHQNVNQLAEEVEEKRKKIIDQYQRYHQAESQFIDVIRKIYYAMKSENERQNHIHKEYKKVKILLQGTQRRLSSSETRLIMNVNKSNAMYQKNKNIDTIELIIPLLKQRDNIYSIDNEIKEGVEFTQNLNWEAGYEKANNTALQELKNQVVMLQDNYDILLKDYYKHIYILRGSLFVKRIDNATSTQEPIEWSESDEKILSDNNVVLKLSLSQTDEQLYNKLIREEHKVKYKMNYPTIRFFELKEHILNRTTDYRDTWAKLPLFDIYSLRPGQKTTIPLKKFLFTATLHTPVSHKISLTNTRSRNLLNLRNNKKELIHYMIDKGKNKASSINLKILEETNTNANPTYAGFYFASVVSANLAKGGHFFEPYYHTPKNTMTKGGNWMDHPRGGLILDIPAMNIIFAHNEHFFSPSSRSILRHSKPDLIKMIEYSLDETPDQVININPTGGKSAWNEVLFTPVGYDDNTSFSTTKILGFFVYTREPNPLNWPKELKVFYNLATLNRLPLVILRNEYTGNKPSFSY